MGGRAFRFDAATIARPFAACDTGGAMQLKIGDLFASPDHYLHAFDGDQAVFLDMDRAAYERSIFVDGRIQPASKRMLRVPVAPLMALNDQRETAAAPDPGWIFHVAALRLHSAGASAGPAGAVRRSASHAAAPIWASRLPRACQAEDRNARLRLARGLLGRRYERAKAWW